jgi:hypothetical protein
MCFANLAICPMRPESDLHDRHAATQTAPAETREPHLPETSSRERERVNKTKKEEKKKN